MTPNKFKRKLVQLTRFLDSLNERDEANFKTLLDVPGAVEGLPKGRWRDMGMLALAVRRAGGISFPTDQR